MTARILSAIGGAAAATPAWLAYRDAAALLLLGERFFLCG